MNLVSFVDLLLKAWAVVTVALVLAKAFELWDPFKLFSHPTSADDRVVTNWIQKKENYLTFLATTAAATPFIGLAGTVMHIIAALTSLSTSGADMSVISGPIALSLYATLWGLASAIPATVFYNLAQRRLQVLENRYRGV